MPLLRRLARAFLPALIPAFMLALSLMLHETITFRFRWALENYDTSQYFDHCGWSYSLVAFEWLLGAAFFLVLFYPLSLWLWPRRIYFPASTVLYCALYALFCLLIPQSYSFCFGATWLWHEPFLGLWMDPLLTPGLLLAGALLSNVLLKRLFQRRAR